MASTCRDRCMTKLLQPALARLAGPEETAESPIDTGPRRRRPPPAAKVAEQAGPEIPRRIDGPCLQVSGGCADGGDQQADDQCSVVGDRRECVELLGNGEDAEHQNSREHDFVDEGVQGCYACVRVGEEYACGAAVEIAAQVVQIVVVIENGREQQIDEGGAKKGAEGLSADIGQHLGARKSPK